MRAFLVLSVAMATALSLGLARGQQPPAPEVSLQPTSARIGDHLQLTVRVTIPQGETPEFAPGTPGWGAVELVSLEAPQPTNTSALGIDWELRAVVAPFALGDLAFAPTIAVTAGSEVRTIQPPPVTIAVLPTLLPDAPLELTPLPPPVAIAGAESPFLRPAIAFGALVALSLLAALATLLLRRLRRLRRRTLPAPPSPAPADPALPALLFVESTIDADPVAAYRALASTVRAELARRFSIPATALTAAELRARLEHSGADRWVARLAGGLLDECDAVVYAGYRPAPERRRADLAIAYELVGES